MNLSEAHEKLEHLYLSKWEELEALRRGFKKPSCSFLIAPPASYFAAKHRVCVVGMQTGGWGVPDHQGTLSADPETAICQLMSKYRWRYEPGLAPTPPRWNIEKRQRSPFWRAFHRIWDAVDGKTSPPSLAWLNFLKFDVDGKRPNKTTRERVSSLGMLRSELSILDPHLVVFFTGPTYDELFDNEFPGYTGEQDPPSGLTERQFAIQHIVGLPARCLRTYHPNYLRLSGLFEKVLERICRDIPGD